MKLAVIDLDGTLTDTNDVDTRLYLQAFQEEFGIRDVNADWADYPHATDEAIAEEIFKRKYARKPSAEEIARLRKRFVRLLEEAEMESAAAFQPIEGASRFLARLESSSEWRGAIATGSWSGSAFVKMRACGLETDVPLVCCYGVAPRSMIVQATISAARHAFQQTAFERIVLLGDGIWDLTTARELDYPFVGIGEGESAQRLIEGGASVILPNYRDLDAVFEALEHAAAP